MSIDPENNDIDISLEEPTLDQLMEWESQGGCEAVCPEGCWVGADGYCPHGNPSWLIYLGLV